jgi:hypothetical protein
MEQAPASQRFPKCEHRICHTSSLLRVTETHAKPSAVLGKLILLGTALVGGSLLYTGLSVPPQPVPMPNITINAGRLQASVVYRTSQFKPTDCAIVEDCVSGPGKRSLMKFDVQTPNVGTADLYLGNPTNNPAFVFSPCHGHYHLEGYAVYELLNLDGTPVMVNGSAVVGHKQAFCLEDYEIWAPNAGPAKYTCSNQGISVGWSDTYGSYLDCQWVDVTGVVPANYLLRVTINGGLNGPHVFAESDYSDNVATVPVTLPKRFQ